MKKFLLSVLTVLFLAASAHASISVQTNKVYGTGNNVTTSFSFPFKIFSASELRVYQIDVNGTEYGPYNLTTDYTVAISTTTEGGFVNFTTAPATGRQTFIKRIEPLTQALVLASEGALPAKQIENQLDKQMMTVIQLNESVSRALQFSQTSNVSGVTFPSPLAGYSIAWNDNGTDLVNKNITGPQGPVGPQGPAGNISGPASSTADNIVTWNATDGTKIKDSGIKIGTGAGNVLQLNSSGMVPSANLPSGIPIETSWSNFTNLSVTGWASGWTGGLYYKKVGSVVFVSFSVNGTSNSSSATVTLPYASAAGMISGGALIYAADNGTAVTTGGGMYMAGGQTTMGLYTNLGVTGTWTASGTKTVYGEFWYEAQ